MAELYDELQAFIGSQEGPAEAGYDVNRAMIQHWCEAIEDGNPLYNDEGYAKKSKYRGIIAPPPMMQTFSGGPRWPRPQKEPSSTDRLTEKLHQAGYIHTIATNNTLEFLRPLRLGDRLTRRSKLVSISTEKKTRAGTGFFVTSETTYTNQRGEVVGTQLFTTLRFKPPER